MLEDARAQMLAIGLGVQEDGGTIDVAGTPLVVRAGVVEVLCHECADIHEIAFEEIDWVEVFDDRSDRLVRELGRGPAPPSRPPTFGGSGRAKRKGGRR
jgi:hypothetical protein